MQKRLVRDRNGAILGGVCVGLGKYLNIDPVIIRIFFVLLTLTSGFGVLLYVILWIVLPREDKVMAEGSEPLKPDDIGERAKLMGSEIKEVTSSSNPHLPIYIGIGLVILGGFAALKVLDIPLVQTINNMLWPALLVLAGIVLLIRGKKGE